MESVTDTARGDPRESSLVRQRNFMLLLSCGSYGVDALILGLFAAFGTGSVPMWAPWTFAASGLGINAFFYFIFRAGWHRRATESYLTLPQMFFAGLVQVVFAMLIPEAALMFLMTLFIIMAFGGLRLTLRQILFGWGVCAVGLTLIVLRVPIQQGWPHTTTAEQLISALAMSLALLRMAYLGSYNYALRLTIHRRSLELDTTLRQIERLATRDELTGALNRRSLQILLEEQLQQAAAGGQSFCLAMLDLDHFKAVNDSHGHLIGDAVLKVFAELANSTTRGTERVGRFGGEEFLAIFNSTSLAAGAAASERVRHAIESHDWSGLAPGLRVTVSVGVAVYKPGDRVETLLQRADAAMYRAKANGRNQVVTEAS